ncbi:glycosyltransferase family 4 protein [Halalkalibacter kiskunsagensis]|uniref:Glycosyltransferase family 4 protein n=1 Tax=Halalkalibacter kiskunsagensis TaxID=1548599 RepID=A0ABV6KIM7_9BACI
MRIAIFTDTYAPEINGVAKTLLSLTSYLEKNQVDFRVFAPDGKTSVPSVPQIERFMSLPFLLYPECRIALPNLLHIKQSLDEFNPTLIHIATPLNLGLYGLHYGKKHHIPMVASYHTHFDDYLHYYHIPFLQKWFWMYMSWFHRPFHKVYVPSESTKAKLLAMSIHDQIELWGRGVNHILFNPNKRENEIREKYKIKQKKIILYVGRIAPEKDIDIVMNTFEALPKRCREDAHLLIVGDGPLLKTMSNHRSEHITFTGFLEGEVLANAYASSDLFLFPSSTETFGNVVLEAMSSGLPIIGANVGGVKHLITHGENGFLCTARDVCSFAEHTMQMLENDQLRTNFGVRARQFALTQSWEEIFARLILSYEDVITMTKQQFSA